ncbi:MAG: hypothetical protein HQ546_09855 [Planctomycetes bacterium]|nr:hypothetical protein [Planctomycetota bacterium]
MKIKTLPLSERVSLIDIEAVAMVPSSSPPSAGDAAGEIDALADRIGQARRRGSAVMLVYGAHLIKNGASPLVNALIEAGAITHVATQGAGVIHDWEFAFQGASSESVRENAPTGRFGSWDETGRAINLAVIAGAAEGLGFGEAIGRFIAEDGVVLPMRDVLADQIAAQPGHSLTAARADLLATMNGFGLDGGAVKVAHPFKKYSVCACAYRHGVPFTVHPGIGYDIYVNHPMFCGGAIGRAAGTDGRIFANSVLNLTGGVYLSVGSAIMSPQVFEKAFSLANNLLVQEGRPFVHDHLIAVVDIQDGGGWDWSAGEPPKGHPSYYLRFCKSFYRMGGQVRYICCDNRIVLANLVSRLT